MNAVASEMPARPLQRLRWVLSLGLLAALMAGMGVWVHGSQVRIVRLRIVGDLAHVTAARIQQVAMPYTRAGFFDVDIDSLRDAVEALPWVAQARVSRQWPGTISIRIREHVPVARWGENGVLTADGDHFVPAAATLPKDLPVLHGPLGTESDLLAEYHAMRQPLAVDGYRITRLWIDKRGSWQVALDNGLVLRLGRDHVNQRVHRFLGAVVDALGQRLGQARYVDLRYGNGFAVGWKDKATGHSGEK